MTIANGVLIAVAGIAVFVAMAITTKTMNKPRLVKATPADEVERRFKADMPAANIRVIPLDKPTPVMVPMPEPKHEDPEPKPEPIKPKPELPKNFVQAPAAVPHIAAPERANNEGICAPYGGHKVFAHRHGWTSWHCVYPHGR